MSEFPLRRNRALLEKAFKLNIEFERKLLNLGLALRHNYQRQPLLPDLFCYPQLQTVTIREMIKKHDNSTPIDDSQLPHILFEAKRSMICIVTFAGKSTLARAMYIASLDRSLVPVIASAEEFSKLTVDGFKKVIESAFKEQYEIQESWKEFEALESNQRVLIIDDFQKIGFFDGTFSRKN